MDRFDEFVGHAFIVALLYGGCHVGRLGAFAFDEKIVGFFDAFPSFVAVHGVIASDHGCDCACAFGAMLLKAFYEALAATGVAVTGIILFCLPVKALKKKCGALDRKSVV